MTINEVLMQIGEYFKDESMKEIESIKREINNSSIEIPEHLDKKLWEITKKYMKNL